MSHLIKTMKIAVKYTPPKWLGKIIYISYYFKKGCILRQIGMNPELSTEVMLV